MKVSCKYCYYNSSNKEENTMCKNCIIYSKFSPKLEEVKETIFNSGNLSFTIKMKKV